MHPRNPHRGRYDFKQLVASCPELARFVAVNEYNDPSIDFANPDAVKMLNRAILKHFYGVSQWDIPPGYLCPPIPGRADYIHHVADLLGACNGDVIPRGNSVQVLDVGVGANCVYPIIGHSEYGWKFLGTEIDPVALENAKKIVDSNERLEGAIHFRLQKSTRDIFRNCLKPEERFDLTVCNPPFHASLEESQAGSKRKWNNLGKGTSSRKAPVLNFGGQEMELWCEGGEVGFIRRMIEESALIPKQCLWFTTLLSKESHLPLIYGALDFARVADGRTMDMAQGQKKSRIVAWTFLSEQEQDEWTRQRWK